MQKFIGSGTTLAKFTLGLTMAAALAGAVFMVARADITSLSELQESAKRLNQSGVPTRGVIFNDLNLSKRRYGYGMGSKYGRYRYTNYQY